MENGRNTNATNDAISLQAEALSDLPVTVDQAEEAKGGGILRGGAGNDVLVGGDGRDAL